MYCNKAPEKPKYAKRCRGFITKYGNTTWGIPDENTIEDVKTKKGKNYTAEIKRYDIQHFFKFGKNRLLMDTFQTTYVKHEPKNGSCILKINSIN